MKKIICFVLIIAGISIFFASTKNVQGYLTSPRYNITLYITHKDADGSTWTNKYDCLNSQTYNNLVVNGSKTYAGSITNTYNSNKCTIKFYNVYVKPDANGTFSLTYKYKISNTPYSNWFSSSYSFKYWLKRPIGSTLYIYKTFYH